ncbi:DUF3221 domain-containing protein [Clostridium baratii]|nr:DUF3221 domain-containing protein [Clostridium baratii]MDU4910672.1 DUF3221 domain-containing protein [Clostridium baratii]CUO94725.1 Uncharacterised protein [Clostridium baratii]
MKKLLLYSTLITLSLFILVGCSLNSKSSMTGIYLKSTDGSNIIIDDANYPTVMGNETSKENIFEIFKSGDKIEITCSVINETYPAQTQIYSLKLIEKGSPNNIPKDTLEKLKELGWTFDLSN